VALSRLARQSNFADDKIKLKMVIVANSLTTQKESRLLWTLLIFRSACCAALSDSMSDIELIAF